MFYTYMYKYSICSTQGTDIAIETLTLKRKHTCTNKSRFSALNYFLQELKNVGAVWLDLGAAWLDWVRRG
jgi:hypothetical protein